MYGCRLSPRKPSLNLSEFRGCRAFITVVRQVVDPRAHGIAPHQQSIVGLQLVGCRSHLRQSRIKPNVVASLRLNDFRSLSSGDNFWF
jgi:hypothetical protein